MKKKYYYPESHRRYLEKIYSDPVRHELWKKKTRERQAAKRKLVISDPVLHEKEKGRQRKYTNRVKMDCLVAYGGEHPKCACCGEDNHIFLTIDHINNDGAEHRRSIAGRDGGRTYNVRRWLRMNNFPPGFQVLCFNCNCGKQINGGRCPHE